jgi:hypothetical protein
MFLNSGAFHPSYGTELRSPEAIRDMLALDYAALH